MEAGRRGKKRFRKKPSEAAVSLSQEDIEFLQVARDHVLQFRDNPL